MIPVVVPAYDQAAHHVEVRSMQNFNFCGIAPQTPLTRINKRETTIYFDINVSALNQRQKKQLKKLKPYSYQVIGFSSHIGSPLFNPLLSFKRASAVADFLKSRRSTICGVYGRGTLAVEPPYLAQKVIVRISRC